MIAYTLTNNSITVVLKNKVYTVSNGQPQWEPTLEAIRNNDENALYNVLSVANTLVSFTEGNVSVKNNQVFYRDVPLDNYVVEKVLEFAKNKLPLQPILRFINNLMKNPSRRAVQELYAFLEHKNMPITPDGNFLAYKGVQSDFYSKTAGTIVVIKGTVKDGRIYNGVGEVIEVERNGVCDDKTLGCSTGLHAGSVAYATTFAPGGKVVLVEINPADVVSVPNDCECQKLRACKYKVVGEYEVPLDNHYNNTFATEDWNSIADDRSDDESNYDSGNNDDDDDGCSNKSTNAYYDGLSALDDTHASHEELPYYQTKTGNANSGDVNKNVSTSNNSQLNAEIARLIESTAAEIKNKINNTSERLRAFSAKINVPPAPPAPVATQLKTTANTAIGQLRDALGKFKKAN